MLPQRFSQIPQKLLTLRITAQMVRPEKFKLSPYAIKLVTPPVCLIFPKKLCALCVLCGSMVLKEVRDQSMNHRGHRGHRESMVSVIVVAIGSYLLEYE